MRKPAIGTRVHHDYLGEGTVEKNILFMTIVKWDKTPEYKYNMSENPSAIFTKELTQAKGIEK